MFKTQNEYKTTSADIAFFMTLILIFAILLNYFGRDFFILISKVLIFIDLYLVHLVKTILDFFGIQIDYLNRLDKIFLLQQTNNIFENVEFKVSFKNNFKIELYNLYNGYKYKHFEEVFNFFYFLNISIIISLVFFLGKVIKGNKKTIGVQIFNKTLKSYYDKILEIPNRKGLNKNIITNDHQYQTTSNNPNYLEDSIKLTLLNNDIKFQEDIVKIKDKYIVLQKNIKELKRIKRDIKTIEKISPKQRPLTYRKINISKDTDILENLKEKLLQKEKEIKGKQLNKEEEQLLKDFDIIQKYKNIKIQYNKQDLNLIIEQIKEKVKDAKENNLKLTLNSTELRVKKYLSLKQKNSIYLKRSSEELKKLNKKTKEELSYIKSIEQEYSRNIEDFNREYDEGVIQTPSYYILHPIGEKILKVNEDGENKNKGFVTPGINIIIELIHKYIIKDYEPNILKEIEDLKNINAKISLKDETERQTYELNLQIISDLERQLDTNDKKSRLKKIKELREKHFFEETYILALWEFGNTITNLPTGPLVKIKFINPVLWYAFTSLKRPSLFKMGEPIYVMFLYEQQEKKEEKIEEWTIEESYNEFRDNISKKFENKIRDYII